MQLGTENKRLYCGPRILSCHPCPIQYLMYSQSNKVSIIRKSIKQQHNKTKENQVSILKIFQMENKLRDSALGKNNNL